MNPQEYKTNFFNRRKCQREYKSILSESWIKNTYIFYPKLSYLDIDILR